MSAAIMAAMSTLIAGVGILILVFAGALFVGGVMWAWDWWRGRRASFNIESGTEARGERRRG